jgi:RNA polymerase sigma factor (TIGR02999 family)
MFSSSTHEVTQLLNDWSDGDKNAFDKLVPLVYAELRRMAHHYMSRERGGQTLQTTILVHEAYLRMVNCENIRPQTRAHFFAIVAQVMRHILVDHARSHACEKRGGKLSPVEIDEAAVVSQERAAEVVALDDALPELAEIDSEAKSDRRTAVLWRVVTKTRQYTNPARQ